MLNHETLHSPAVTAQALNKADDLWLFIWLWLCSFGSPLEYYIKDGFRVGGHTEESNKLSFISYPLPLHFIAFFYFLGAFLVWFWSLVRPVRRSHLICGATIKWMKSLYLLGSLHWTVNTSHIWLSTERLHH